MAAPSPSFVCVRMRRQRRAGFDVFQVEKDAGKLFQRNKVMTMQLLKQSRRSATLFGICVLFAMSLAGCHPAESTSKPALAGIWIGDLPSVTGAPYYTLLTFNKDGSMLQTYYEPSRGWGTVHGTYTVHKNIVVATSNTIRYDHKFHPLPKYASKISNFQYSIAGGKLTLVETESKDTYMLESVKAKS